MRFASTTSNGASPRRQAPGARADPAGEPVAARVRDGRLDRDRVGVDADAPSRAEPDRRDREDPRAAADVEDARAARAAPRSASASTRREAQPGRRVEPGPERHPRVEREDDVVGRARDAAARSAG